MTESVPLGYSSEVGFNFVFTQRSALNNTWGTNEEKAQRGSWSMIPYYIHQPLSLSHTTTCLPIVLTWRRGCPWWPHPLLVHWVWGHLTGCAARPWCQSVRTPVHRVGTECTYLYIPKYNGIMRCHYPTWTPTHVPAESPTNAYRIIKQRLMLHSKWTAKSFQSNIRSNSSIWCRTF